jgi:hypothetical protein
MYLDRGGLELTAPSIFAVESYDRALDRLAHFEPDMMGPLLPVLTEPDTFPLAEIFRVYLDALSMDPDIILPSGKKFSMIRHKLADLSLTARERGHVEAAAQLLAGNLTAASRILADISAEYPLDLLALAIGHQIDYIRGDAVSLRDRVGAALRHWHEEGHNYPAVLGMYAFGLEENGNWEYSEDIGTRAADLDSRNVWAIHAVAHANEMRARFGAGMRWLDARRRSWDTENQIRGHIMWHYGLYLLEAGETARVLALYDGALAPAAAESKAPVLVNGSSMLWRLYLEGVDVSERFAVLAREWRRYACRAWWAFNDIHAVMCYTGSDDIASAAALISDREAYVSEAPPGIDNATVTAQLGLPVCKALVAFHVGRYNEAFSLMQPIREILYRCGGSHAQRDVLHQTLLEAAIRANRWDQASRIASERVAIRPDSPVNWEFFAKLATARGDPHMARTCEQRALRLVADAQSTGQD